MKQARLLLSQLVRVRKKAVYLRKQTYVSASNSLIRTLTQLMRAIGQSKVDKDKVEQILGMLKKKAEDIDSDLDKEMRPKTTEETRTVSTTASTTETTVPTTGTTAEETTTVDTTVLTTGTTTEEITTEQADQISDTDRTAYTKQARSLIKECVRLRKKASQSGQQKYVASLNSYIKALASLRKRVRVSTFDKKQVQDALKMLKTNVSEVDSFLEQGISAEGISLPDEIVKVTTPSVSEVGDFIVFVAWNETISLLIIKIILLLKK